MISNKIKINLIDIKLNPNESDFDFHFQESK